MISVLKAQTVPFQPNRYIMVISAFFLFVAAGASIFAINIFTRAFSMVITLLKWILRFIFIAVIIGLLFNYQTVFDIFVLFTEAILP